VPAITTGKDVDVTGPPSALEEALSRVGDRWALLVVNALLDGPRRFNELLDAMPGLAPNVLSKRLKHLEQEGVVVATPYSRRPPRFTYQLTATGSDLAGALRLLEQWGSGHAPSAEVPHHDVCGTAVEARWWCPTCERVVDTRDSSGTGDADELRFA
jgi:DNA-binding HxlR family transcriptional regulator